MDIFNSFFQNIKDKLTSPFFGTLSFVILIHHWVFWYSLFNLDSEYTITEKVAILKETGASEFHLHNIISDIAWTILIMVLGYGIVVGTRSLSLFIDFGIMPGITKKLINKNVVARTEFEDMLKERDNYAERYEEERKNGRVLSKDYDEQLAQVQDKNKSVIEANEQITELNKAVKELNLSLSQEIKRASDLSSIIATKQGEIDKFKIDIENLKITLANHSNDIEIYRNVFFNEENTEYWQSINQFPPTIVNKAKEIMRDGLWYSFKQVVYFERNGGSISTAIFEQLAKYDVLTLDGHDRLNAMGKIIEGNMERLENIFGSEN